MGKNKAKKVKKAWRKISTQDIDDFNDKSTRDAHSGGSLASAPGDSFFFLDKSTDVPVKRKIDKHREKTLRFESVLERNPFVQPIPSSTHKKSRKKEKENATQVQSQDGSLEKVSALEKEDGNLNSDNLDIWSSEGADNNNTKGKMKAKPSLIPAVEVEPPGCSFNPEAESHKNSLAQAVAEEMNKVYRTELEPQLVPLTVPGDAITEEERYFLDVDNGDEDEVEEENQIVNAGTEGEKRTSKEKRVTKVERNRRIRWKEQLRAETEAKKVEELSKEIDSIQEILKEIAEEDEEKRNRHIRRKVAKEERLKSCPPRLGKRKFEPAPVQVLLSEEITGSLRKLKACCTLARDRFKSLEKRGLIVPSAKSGRK